MMTNSKEVAEKNLALAKKFKKGDWIRLVLGILLPMLLPLAALILSSIDSIPWGEKFIEMKSTIMWVTFGGAILLAVFIAYKVIRNYMGRRTAPEAILRTIERRGSIQKRSIELKRKSRKLKWDDYAIALALIGASLCVVMFGGKFVDTLHLPKWLPVTYLQIVVYIFAAFLIIGGIIGRLNDKAREVKRELEMMAG